MRVFIKRADGQREHFETAQFLMSKPEDMNPLIVEVTIYNERGRRIDHWKRPGAKEYMKNYKAPEPAPEPPEMPAEPTASAGEIQP